jgi:tetratricopeptide (TPR) repeat protein
MRSVEARVELARCFYKQGLFEMARANLANAVSGLGEGEPELKTACLTLWGVVERDSGRLTDALKLLREAASLEEAGSLAGIRCYSELATTLKDLSISEKIEAFGEEAKMYFERALYASEAIGHHRNTAILENNLGFLLLNLKRFDESESHLLCSKRLFVSLSDAIRGAQVNETLSRLYIETKRYDDARLVIDQAVETLERSDGEAHLAEALRTAGVVAARQGRSADARKNFEAAFKVTERCGDKEGAGQALLMMFEEIREYLDDSEKTQIAEKAKILLDGTQQTTLQVRIKKCLEEITNTKARDQDKLM